MSRSYSAQGGFAAIAAIFLVVTLAALGGFMLTFSNTQQLTFAQDVQGARAYWAANAGLEWGLGSIGPQARETASCPVSPSSLNGFDGSMTVVVSCTRSTYNEAGQDKIIFELTSVASNQSQIGSVGFVERSLSTSIEK
ncbi:MAG: hypothetical protein H7172_02335 [Ferruginibacter sp.]|nr:hypothetical protein [Rhodoferax sp.]